MDNPTDSALKLAVKLSGHTGCGVRLLTRLQPCDGCVADARTIDKELLLPEKHAALLLAQALIDSEDREGCDPSTFAPDLVDQLRTALDKLR